MSLKARLTDDMKAAMKGGDKDRLGVIRLVNAAIKQREVDERIVLDDAAIVGVGLTLLALTSSLPMFFVAASVMGVGIGAFFAVDLALITETSAAAMLPKAENRSCIARFGPAAVVVALIETAAGVAAAAEAGKEASKAMIAQFGRAKTLGEACIGFPDAGACSVVVMLNAMSDYVKTGA